MSDDVTNVWADVPDWGGIGAARLVRAPNGSLNASIWELPPGGSQFVYHFHHGTEELLVVLRCRSRAAQRAATRSGTTATPLHAC
jgi:hypothetical protein